MRPNSDFSSQDETELHSHVKAAEVCISKGPMVWCPFPKDLGWKRKAIPWVFWKLEERTDLNGCHLAPERERGGWVLTVLEADTHTGNLTSWPLWAASQKNLKVKEIHNWGVQPICASLRKLSVFDLRRQGGDSESLVFLGRQCECAVLFTAQISGKPRPAFHL